MPEPSGRSLPLSLPRRFVTDLVHFARKVPAVTVKRRMALAPLVSARQRAAPRPAWVAVFVKAYGRVAAARPELRRAYLSLPWPRLYEHPRSLAAVAVERRLGDETGVFFATLPEPENRGLLELDAAIRRHKEEPLDQLGTMRRILRVSRLPRLLRRLLWSLIVNGLGVWRARYLGTFGFSAVAGLGAGIEHLLSPLSTTLSYEALAADGSLDVRLTFDHRVMDAGTVARALADLEGVLLGEIVEELRSMPARDAA
jgi:hypothetical protein